MCFLTEDYCTFLFHFLKKENCNFVLFIPCTITINISTTSAFSKIKFVTIIKNKTWVPYKMENLEYVSDNLCCQQLLTYSLTGVTIYCKWNLVTHTLHCKPYLRIPKCITMNAQKNNFVVVYRDQHPGKITTLWWVRNPLKG